MPSTHYILNHFPKTGGTSLLAVCRDNLEPEEISPHLVDADIRFGPARFEHYRLIAGHSSVLTQAGFCRKRDSITLLRNSIERTFSAYIYGQLVSEFNSLTSKAKALSFTEFVLSFKDNPLLIYSPYSRTLDRPCQLFHHRAQDGRPVRSPHRVCNCNDFGPSSTGTLRAIDG